MTPIVRSPSVRCRGVAALVFLAIAWFGAAAAAPGCAALGRGGQAPLAPPGPIVVSADWDDLDAAMDVAAERCEMAVVRATDPSGDSLSRRYELRTVAAEPVLVVATRAEPDPSTGRAPQAVTVRATVGRFGDPEREAALLAALRRRLGQLRGVDSSPL